MLNNELDTEMRDKALIAELFAGEVRSLEMELLAGMIADEAPEYLADLVAYIRVARSRQVNKIEIQFNVVHDLVNYGQTCFVPRSHGYAKREQEDR